MNKFDYEIDNFMSCCQSKGLSKKSMRSYEQTFDTGMRIGETLSIDITTDLDLQNRVIRLRAEITKAKVARTVFFSVKMCELLKKWIKFKDRYIESSLLFPVQLRDKPLFVNNFEKNYKKYYNRVGIVECSPHGL